MSRVKICQKYGSAQKQARNVFPLTRKKGQTINKHTKRNRGIIRGLIFRIFRRILLWNGVILRENRETVKEDRVLTCDRAAHPLPPSPSQRPPPVWLVRGYSRGGDFEQRRRSRTFAMKVLLDCGGGTQNGSGPKTTDMRGGRISNK